VENTVGKASFRSNKVPLEKHLPQIEPVGDITLQSAAIKGIKYQKPTAI
jgi:hypothetical protein